MGSAQSIHTTPEIKEIPRKEEAPPSSVDGLKQSIVADEVLVEPQMISLEEEASSDESDDDSDDDDDEEGMS